MIKSILRNQNFLPSFFGVFVNPFYIARASLRDAVAQYSIEIGGNLLDVGCGTKPYRKLFSVDNYVGLEIDTDAARCLGVADYFYDGSSFPFDDEEFDTVVCNQVLEHVFNPEGFLGEIARVLKPGGQLLLTVPFVWDEHEQPYDYARYSSFGLHALLERRCFKVIEHQKTCADASIIFQLINTYIYKLVAHLPHTVRAILTGTIMAFFTILGLLLGRILPDNPDLFLDHVVLAEKTV